MNSFRLVYFFFCILFIAGCSASKHGQEVIYIDAVKPPNLVISNNSAYYADDTLFTKSRVSSSDTLKTSNPVPDPDEKEPTVIRNVIPNYPHEAPKNYTTDTVKVKIYVDTHGNPRKATIMQSSNVIFNECCLIAAMQWKFTPAIMYKSPVPVWISVPFRFTYK